MLFGTKKRSGRWGEVMHWKRTWSRWDKEAAHAQGGHPPLYYRLRTTLEVVGVEVVAVEVLGIKPRYVCRYAKH